MSWLDKFISSAPSGPAGGSLGGNYPNPTVLQLDGNSGVLPILATSGITGQGSLFPAPWALVGGQTGGATPLILDTNPIPDVNSTYFLYIILGRDTVNGDTYRGTFAGTYTRTGGAPVTVEAMALVGSAGTSGAANTWVVTPAVSGNNLVTTVTGAAGRTVNWVVQRTQQQRG
jgi:hypothetical protein